jgi:hypothetical protein
VIKAVLEGAELLIEALTTLSNRKTKREVIYKSHMATRGAKVSFKDSRPSQLSKTDFCSKSRCYLGCTTSRKVKFLRSTPHTPNRQQGEVVRTGLFLCCSQLIS